MIGEDESGWRKEGVREKSSGLVGSGTGGWAGIVLSTTVKLAKSKYS